MFGTTATLDQTLSGPGPPFPQRGRLTGLARPAPRKFTDRQQSPCPDVPAAGSHGTTHPARWGSRISGSCVDAAGAGLRLARGLALSRPGTVGPQPFQQTNESGRLPPPV